MYLNPWKAAGAPHMMQAGTAVGRTFYVNSNVGSDAATNTGQDPASPLDTITHALTLCDTGANDYIFVQRVDNTAETWPIAVTISYVHIIGTPFQASPTPRITPDEDAHGFDITGGGGVEIAGFNFSTDDEGWMKACIHVGPAGSWMNHIHHNWFAWDDEAYDCISLDGAIQTFIHDNYMGAHGFTRYGIHDGVAGASDRTIIRDNYIAQAGNVHQGTYGIYCQSHDQSVVLDNYFRTEGSGNGEAIYASGSTCTFIGNHAANGVAAACATNPYLDLADNNHWSENYSNQTPQAPA